NFFKSYADELSEIADRVSANKEEYIIHPINQYHLIKRFATQWTEVNQLLDRFNRTGTKVHKAIKNAAHLFPKEEDIKGSAEGILRIQETYNLNTSDIAKGNISGQYSLKKLTTDECYHIGKAAFNGGLYDRCTQWMQFSLQRFEEGTQNFSKAHAEEYLKLLTANRIWIAPVLKLKNCFIHIPHTKNNLFLLHFIRTTENKITFYRRRPIVATKAHISSDDKSYKFSDDKKFSKVCRGDVKIPKHVERKLHCYLHTNNGNPWLMFNPVKVEELWDSPHIVQFYDVITSAEVDKIKKLAKPSLFRAIHVVSDEEDDDFQKAAYRITKISWLNDTSGPVIAKLTRRISEITGLSMNTSEELQVANYGVGGEYPPHLDVASEDEQRIYMLDHPEGRRIATFLIYLSEVQEGGGTAFVEAGVTAKPIKGSAVFWYNMYPSGDIDIRTFHGACPVMIGNKWASNKWIREAGEPFHRQCKLDRNADNRIF
uniref:procollagen-proline 4-dioxygenase n=1 Tax=Ciona savignyi TaxID=51511 RepID=H2ZF12_CIOSA